MLSSNSAFADDGQSRLDAAQIGLRSRSARERIERHPTLPNLRIAPRKVGSLAHIEGTDRMNFPEGHSLWLTRDHFTALPDLVSIVEEQLSANPGGVRD